MPKIPYKIIDEKTIEYETKISDYSENISKSRLTVPFDWIKPRKDKKFKIIVQEID